MVELQTSEEDIYDFGPLAARLQDGGRERWSLAANLQADEGMTWADQRQSSKQVQRRYDIDSGQLQSCNLTEIKHGWIRATCGKRASR